MSIVFFLRYSGKVKFWISKGSVATLNLFWFHNSFKYYLQFPSCFRNRKENYFIYRLAYYLSFFISNYFEITHIIFSLIGRCTFLMDVDVLGNHGPSWPFILNLANKAHRLHLLFWFIHTGSSWIKYSH